MPALWPEEFAPHRAPLPLARTAAWIVAWAIGTARLWAARHGRRANLASVAALGERTIRDVGYDPDLVRAEAAKPFRKA